MERNALSAVQFQNPARDVIKKIAVMGHGNDGAFILLQMLLEPLHGFGIKMIGRLVQQQDVGLLNQQAAERHTSFLSARQCLHFGVRRSASQGVHRDLELILQLPPVHRFDLFLQLSLLLNERVHYVSRNLPAQLFADRLVIPKHGH